MLQLFFQKQLGKSCNFWKDIAFTENMAGLDVEMRLSARDDHTQPRKRPCTIDFNTEEQLCDQNALGDDNPEKLVNTLLFTIGIHLGIYMLFYFIIAIRKLICCYNLTNKE